MQRGPLFLAAAFVEVLRFLSLMVLAEASGLLEAPAFNPALLRHVAAAQLLFFAIFFFLWFDQARYLVFRPLALVGKALSLLTLLPVLVAILGGLPHPLSIPLPGLALLSAIALLAAELFTLLTLALYRRIPESRATESLGDAPRRSPEGPPQEPDDIEKVEVIG